jgi:hypothetical protein
MRAVLLAGVGWLVGAPVVLRTPVQLGLGVLRLLRGGGLFGVTLLQQFAGVTDANVFDPEAVNDDPVGAKLANERLGGDAPSIDQQRQGDRLGICGAFHGWNYLSKARG